MKPNHEVSGVRANGSVSTIERGHRFHMAQNEMDRAGALNLIFGSMPRHEFLIELIVDGIKLSRIVQLLDGPFFQRLCTRTRGGSMPCFAASAR